MIQTVGAVEGKDSQQQDAVVSSHSSGEKKLIVDCFLQGQKVRLPTEKLKYKERPLPNVFVKTEALNYTPCCHIYKGILAVEITSF